MAGAALTAAVLAVAAPASASVTCSWTPLDAPDGLQSPDVVAGSGNGLYAGTAYPDWTGDHAVVWEDDVPRSLGRAFGRSPDVFDVNDAGTVVARGGGQPARHTGGAWERLPSPAGTTGAATGINDAGDVFGAIDYGKLIFWPADEPGTYEMVTSPFPGYNFSIDLDEDGTLLARGVVAGGGTQAGIRTPDGVWTLLDRPAPDDEVFPAAISGDRIVGTSNAGAIEWNRAGDVVRVVPGASAVDVNPAGQVLLHRDGGPEVWRDGVQEVELPPVDGVRMTGVSLDDDGDVLGEFSEWPPRPHVGRCA